MYIFYLYARNVLLCMRNELLNASTNVIKFSNSVEFDLDFTNEIEIAENIIPRNSEFEYHSQDEISLTSLNMGRIFDPEENAHFYLMFYAQMNGFALDIKNKTFRKDISLSARFLDPLSPKSVNFLFGLGMIWLRIYGDSQV